MESIELILWGGGFIVLLLALAGIQRQFFPHTLVNGFMNLEKLKAICPELFKEKNTQNDQSWQGPSPQW